MLAQCDDDKASRKKQSQSEYAHVPYKVDCVDLL